MDKTCLIALLEKAPPNVPVKELRTQNDRVIELAEAVPHPRSCIKSFDVLAKSKVSVEENCVRRSDVTRSEFAKPAGATVDVELNTCFETANLRSIAQNLTTAITCRRNTRPSAPLVNPHITIDDAVTGASQRAAV
jgi:hypothetical protein